VYVDQTDFSPQLAARLADVEAEIAEVSVELSRAEDVLAEAKEESFRARARFSHFCLRISRASKQHLDDLLGVLAGALADEEFVERKLRDAADAKLTRAEKDLANLQWRRQSLMADVAQLRKALGPLPLEGAPLEIVPRPRRPEVDADDIVLPPVARSAA
jgi:chromosome segregation ATPase